MRRVAAILIGVLALGACATGYDVTPVNDSNITDRAHQAPGCVTLKWTHEGQTDRQLGVYCKVPDPTTPPWATTTSTIYQGQTAP